MKKLKHNVQLERKGLCSLYLTRNLPAMKYWWRWEIRSVWWQWMYVDWVKLITLEKPLPQRRQRYRASSQEHERNLTRSIKGVFFDLRNNWSSPEQLCVIHRMQQTRRRPNPTLQTKLLKTGLKSWLYHRNYILHYWIPNHIHTKQWKYNTNTQKQQQELK